MLTAIALMAVVVVAGFGYWVFNPRMPTQLSATMGQTSLLTPRRTYARSTMSQTTISGTTVWVNVSATQQDSHYVSLLKSNGSQPYVQLGSELQLLPDVSNATAVAKIACLAGYVKTYNFQAHDVRVLTR